MSHSNGNASSLLVENSDLFDNLEIESAVLDLACGKGRNGLFLVSHNVPVIFADNNEAHLQSISPALESENKSANKNECWLVDFEAAVSEGRNPLAGKVFDAVIVFNYLHRPLFPFIREAIRPGGLIAYETFTVDQKRFGRPRNPDFLLKAGELRQLFKGWERLVDFEGEAVDPDRAIARLIARKQAN
ncbi:MAG: type 12 methyltransferase [Pseudohongiella sp.]|nr:MAG: type 12 methyltransferase [Pseudohongiella sp.]